MCAPPPSLDGTDCPRCPRFCATVFCPSPLQCGERVLPYCDVTCVSQAGVGSFQFVLFLVLGLSLAADTIELFVVAYVIPRSVSCHGLLKVDNYLSIFLSENHGWKTRGGPSSPGPITSISWVGPGGPNI